MKITLSIFLFLLLQIPFSFAQQKLEKESRIKSNEVPQAALDFVDQLNFSKKIKWYKEEGLNKTSLEAKTKHEKRKYSVEFNSSGEIEDIEIKVGWNTLPPATQKNITEYLQSKYDKYKLKKIQIQYSGQPNLLINTIKQMINQPEVLTRYEIIVNAKTKKGREQFEYLFSETGQKISKSKIIFRNTDHLEF